MLQILLLILLNGGLLSRGNNAEKFVNRLLLFRFKLRLPGYVVRAVSGHAWHARIKPKDQEDAHILQAPPAQDDEILLRYQPQPRRQGPQATIAKDWSSETSPAGN